jgi:hypothetical protein
MVGLSSSEHVAAVSLSRAMGLELNLIPATNGALYIRHGRLVVVYRCLGFAMELLLFLL